MLHRQQFVEVRLCSSDRKEVCCGVPQGSILGPLLFLLYVNDMANVSSLLSFILFADDTNAFISGRDVGRLVDILNEKLRKLDEWLRSNKLSINLEKTTFMLFKTKSKPCSLTKPVVFSQQKISKVSSTRFLGIVIDENLTWKAHIAHISKKIARSIGIIAKARKVFNSKTCISLYYSLLFPYLIYCIEVWGAAYVTTLRPVTILQKKPSE